MSISKDEVKYVAELARLDFSEEEIEKLQNELSAVLDYAQALDKYNTDDVKPTEHILPIQNVFREDIAVESLPIEKVLANAPDSEAGAFKVPKVIE